MLDAKIKGTVLSKRIKEANPNYENSRAKTIIEVLQISDQGEKSNKFDITSEDLNIKVEPLKSYDFDCFISQWKNNQTGAAGMSIKVVNFKEDTKQSNFLKSA
jgi:hypothetical protein